MAKVVLKGHVLIPHDDLKSVLEELPLHKELTRQEEGCLIFEVIQDESQVCKLNVYEEFKSKTAFQYHQDRVRSSRWGSITKNIKRFYEIQYL